VTTARRESDIAVATKQLRLIFAGLMLGVLLASLDQTVVATALPTIVGDLGGLNHLSWVVTSYLLASTVSAPLYGKLGDLYGRKIIFQIGIVIFIVGSLLCGLSQSMFQLIAFRALQGLGAGGVVVGPQAIIADIIPPAERGRYSGLMGSVYALASVLGPLIGGVFTDTLSWRWVFIINLPLGAFTFIVIGIALPASKKAAQQQIDYLGTALLGGAAAALILLLTWGGSEYGWTSPVILGLLFTSAALLIAFVKVEERVPEPLIPLRLFKSSVFTVSVISVATITLAMLGTTTFLPLLVQTVRGVSPLMSGFETAPIVGFMLVSTIWVGRRIAATGRYHVFPLIGGVLMVLGSTGIAMFGTGTDTPYWQSAIGMGLFGAGVGFSTVVYVLTVQNAVATKDLGVATSTASFGRAIGGSIGVAVFGGLFTHRLNSAMPSKKALEGIDPTKVTPAQLGHLQHQSPDAYDAFVRAFDHALQGVFWAVIPFTLIALGLAFRLKEEPLRRVRHVATEPADVTT
jgi:EmrB/QacA subfamily drug resistance transporter